MSAFAMLNGTPIVGGLIVLPFSGIWHADLVLDRVFPTVGPQVIQLADLSLTGTSARSADYAGQTRCRIVGGQNGWSTVLPAKQYTQIPQSIVMLDAALSVLEVVVPPVPDVICPSYFRRQGPASAVLQDIVGPGWWMDQTGTVQTIPRLPTPIILPFAATDVEGEQGRYRIETDTLSVWMPGATFLNTTNILSPVTIGRVMHRVTTDRLVTEVLV
jgi:hypothetical protein